MAVKGLTQASGVVAISAGITETAANTFTQESVDLNLSPLDREVFVVLAIDVNLTPPDAVLRLIHQSVVQSRPHREPH